MAERTVRLADCTNVPLCSKARANEALEWYNGPGEYCPECGEALTPREPSRNGQGAANGAAAAHTRSEAPATAPERSAEPSRPSAPEARRKTPPRPLVQRVPAPPPPPAAPPAAPSLPPHREPAAGSAPRWLLPLALALVACGALAFFALRAGRIASSSGDGGVAVCSFPAAQHVADDLIQAYSIRSGLPQDTIKLVAAGTCDVRFSPTPEASDQVIATDGIVPIVNPLNPVDRISEKDLRGIFSGSITDWSQLGGPAGAIVPLLTDASSDESKVLDSSLFLGITIASNVHRAGSSADVTRLVTGADAAARR